MKRPFQRKGSILITLGLLMVLSAIGLILYNIYDGHRAYKASQKVISELDIPENDTAESIGEEYTDRDMPTMEVDGYLYIGKLEVPDLDLTLPVMQEWDYKRLKISPCRYSGSVYQDNMIIAGHNYAKHFSALKWLDIGTEIKFIDVEGIVWDYNIVSIETLKPDQVSDLLDQTREDWDLTLFTCNTGGQTRCVIRCERKKKFDK